MKEEKYNIIYYIIYMIWYYTNISIYFYALLLISTIFYVKGSDFETPPPK